MRELGVGFVAYSRIGRGFLSGEIRTVDDLAPDDFRRNNPRFQGENLTKNLELVDRVREIAAEKAQGPGSFAMHLIDALAALDEAALAARMA
mgnify:CR=1 FL=1